MFDKNTALSATDIKNFKARVKAEMNRRKYYGSLTGYAASSYDYSTVPNSGVTAYTEHANKNITPLNAVKSTGISTVSAGNSIAALSALATRLSAIEQTGATSSTNDCASYCSGLCKTQCSTGCSSCSGGCSGGCTSCQGCSGGCQGCGDQCSSGCRYLCYGDCWGTCVSDCTGDCTWTCVTWRAWNGN